MSYSYAEDAEKHRAQEALEQETRRKEDRERLGVKFETHTVNACVTAQRTDKLRER